MKGEEMRKYKYRVWRDLTDFLFDDKEPIFEWVVAETVIKAEEIMEMRILRDSTLIGAELVGMAEWHDDSKTVEYEDLP